MGLLLPSIPKLSPLSGHRFCLMVGCSYDPKQATDLSSMSNICSISILIKNAEMKKASISEEKYGLESNIL